jgi:hypothetical protein
MRTYRWFLLVCGIAAFAASPLFAQDDKKADDKPAEKAKPKAEEGPAEYDVSFWDGSNIVVTVESDTLSVKTKYGAVPVSWKSVKRIEFTAKPAAGKPKPAVTVDAADLSLRGALDFADVKVSTKSFGSTTLKFDMVKVLRRVNAAMTADEFGLKADKYAKQMWKEWYDTGIVVAADGPLEIVCSGEIDQWPQTPGQYQSKPRGTGSIVSPPPGGDRLMLPGSYNPGGGPGYDGPPGSAAMRANRLSSGMVVGKIGETGAPFLVGDKYATKKAPAGGKLYLIIAPSNWGNDSAGEYKVKVSTNE